MTVGLLVPPLEVSEAPSEEVSQIIVRRMTYNTGIRGDLLAATRMLARAVVELGFVREGKGGIFDSINCSCHGEAGRRLHVTDMPC